MDGWSQFQKTNKSTRRDEKVSPHHGPDLKLFSIPKYWRLSMLSSPCAKRARAVIDKQSPTVGLGNPVTRVSNGLGAVQFYNFDNINLVQAVAHIWRQWVTDDSGLN